jgi:hypothetical protein
MIITKLITTAVDISNCVNFCSDGDNIRHLLENKFVGKCYRGCYIQRINKIVRVGECVINGNTGTVAVIFEVTGLIFPAGDIICCTVINKQEDNILIAGTEICSIIMLTDSRFDSIAVNQIIAAQVIEAQYVIASPKIAVNAIPYLPPLRAQIYKLAPVSDWALFDGILADIKAMEGRAAALIGEKAWDTFNKLLYVYKEPQTLSSIDLVAQVAKKELIGVSGESLGPHSYIARDTRLDLSRPLVHIYETIGDSVAPVIESMSGEEVIITLLTDYYRRIKLLCDMVSAYSTEQLVRGHGNLWKIYIKNKANNAQDLPT